MRIEVFKDIFYVLMSFCLFKLMYFCPSVYLNLCPYVLMFDNITFLCLYIDV